MPSLPSIRLPACAFLVALLGSLPALAAPLPVGPEKPPPLEKYLLDDTDWLAVLNVKDLVRAPLFVKDHKKNVEKALAKAPLGPLFESLGIAPLKDIDRVVLAWGRSSFDKDREVSDGVFLVSGRFDLERMRAGLARLAKAPTRTTWVAYDPACKLYRLENLIGRGTLFIVPLDAHTVLLTRRQDHATDAAAKALGRKVTRLKVPGMPARLKRLNPDAIVEAFALETAIVDQTLSVSKNGNGEQESKRTTRTLADVGVKEVEVRATLKDEAQVRLVLTAMNKARAKEHAQMFEDQLRMSKRLLAGNPRGNLLGKFAEGIRLRSADLAVSLEARATGEMVRDLLDLLRFAL